MLVNLKLINTIKQTARLPSYRHPLDTPTFVASSKNSGRNVTRAVKS